MAARDFEQPCKNWIEDSSVDPEELCDSSKRSFTSTSSERLRCLVRVESSATDFERLLATRGAFVVEMRAAPNGTSDPIELVGRVLESDQQETSFQNPKTKPLIKWRLNRALAFIEANLGSPIALADLSRAAGLSRMHFAAQFRAAMGIRPHDYVLRRRIEKAQEILLASEKPIVEVSAALGFNSQAHFTSVFKRITGLTPCRWRDRERA